MTELKLTKVTKEGLYRKCGIGYTGKGTYSCEGIFPIEDFEGEWFKGGEDIFKHCPRCVIKIWENDYEGNHDKIIQEHKNKHPKFF